ncbi:MAG: stage II sporulation protein M [Flammeovirgaceae bacterium]
MREAQFMRKNREKWLGFEKVLENQFMSTPDRLADLFAELTNDLSYARTFFPQGKTVKYLNGLSARVHQSLYKNKKEKKERLITFWKSELPLLMAETHPQMLYAFLFFLVSCLIGALSAHYDDTFVRLILGDDYVNMTIENIRKGDPMYVYKDEESTGMFLRIALNNVRVSFLAFALGILGSFGTIYILFNNGVMVGSFQYFFFQYGGYELLKTSALSIWIHGTLEISAIIIAGGAGLVMGNSLLFPNTYSRLASFKKGAKKGLKVIIGLVPIFIFAAFLEGFVTRLTDLPNYLKMSIILFSAFFIFWYFVWYPIRLKSIGHKN